MVTKTSSFKGNGEYGEERLSPEEDTHVFLWWWNFQLERIKAVKASWKCLQIFLCVKIVQFLKLPKLNSPHHRLYLLLRLLLANIYTNYLLPEDVALLVGDSFYSAKDYAAISISCHHHYTYGQSPGGVLREMR